MRRVPEKINKAWIETLADAEVLEVEAWLYDKFETLDRKQKKLRGRDYNLLQGPTTLIDAWDRWSRMVAVTKSRSLVVRRRVAIAEA
ncbi:MAG: hypothetical protein NTZ43_08545 [Gemmatimonadetes bacterium]|nr:hypothetical protein [Gemmatimonadota bacterium]